DVARGHPHQELAIATREGRYEEEGWRVRKDGSLFWASVTITAIRDAHGALRGFAKVTRDLTQRRAAEEQRMQLMREQTAREAADTVRPAADARRIELRSTLPFDPQFVWGDPDRLQQVVWNLLSNAVKFTPTGGRVEVTVTRPDSHVELTIRDNGAGIAADFLPHIFEMFRQADATSSRAHGGLGLGLAIVKRL